MVMAEQFNSAVSQFLQNATAYEVAHAELRPGQRPAS